MERIVVIGAVAAGMSAASQAKRRKKGAQVIVLERGTHVSYGACGMPYNLQDPERPMDDLVVISAEKFREERGIDLRTEHEVLRVDREKRVLLVRDRVRGQEYEQPYDALVFATGATVVNLPLKGMDLEGVVPLRTLADGHAIKDRLASGSVKDAVILGAGYIGMEMAETLRARGVQVTVLEKLPQVIPSFEPELAKLVHAELVRHGVRVEAGTAVTEVQRGAGGRLSVLTSRGVVEADLVLSAVGIRPNVALARAAGIALGPTGAIAVDATQRTNDPHVFAAGDCAEAFDRVVEHAVWVPLGTTANKQGKVAGANAAGASERFAGITSTAVFKVFDLEVGRTGMARADVERLGVDAVVMGSSHRTRGHGQDASKPIDTVLFVARESRRLLGAQIVGGEGVKGRIDVLATALYAKLTVDDLAALDLAYAPPLAPVWDAVLIAAGVAQKALESKAR
jgi:NADPH-dependent 2,4-dienoyl-CoA reductase/sulfur reductase-like enzyme